MKMNQRSRGGVYEHGERTSFGSPCRVGAAGCPTVPLTEPDLRASHSALWIVVSEDQTKLVRDFHGRIRYAPDVAMPPSQYLVHFGIRGGPVTSPSSCTGGHE